MDISAGDSTPTSEASYAHSGTPTATSSSHHHQHQHGADNNVGGGGGTNSGGSGLHAGASGSTVTAAAAASTLGGSLLLANALPRLASHPSTPVLATHPAGLAKLVAKSSSGADVTNTAQSSPLLSVSGAHFPASTLTTGSTAAGGSLNHHNHQANHHQQQQQLHHHQQSAVSHHHHTSKCSVTRVYSLQLWFCVIWRTQRLIFDKASRLCVQLRHPFVYPTPIHH